MQLGRQPSSGSPSSTPLVPSVVYGSDGESFSSGTVAPFDVYEAAGDTTPLLSLQLSTTRNGTSESLATENAANLVLTGFAMPELNPGSDATAGPALDLFAVSPDGQVTGLDRAARIQVVHGSFEDGATYTVSSEGDTVASGLTQLTASPTLSVSSGVGLNVRVRNGGSTLLTQDFSVETGATERWVVVGETSSTLDVARVPFQSERAAFGTFEANAVHAAAFLGASDFHLSPIANVSLESPEVENVTLGGSAPAPTVRPFSDQRFTVTGVGGQTPVASFDVLLSTSVFSEEDTLLFIVTGSAELSGQGLDLLVVNQDGETAMFDPN
ncbi:MAG: hypothetical protein AAFX94_23945, partial [Myxococcota bacterium]